MNRHVLAWAAALLLITGCAPRALQTWRGGGPILELYVAPEAGWIPQGRTCLMAVPRMPQGAGDYAAAAGRLIQDTLLQAGVFRVVERAARRVPEREIAEEARVRGFDYVLFPEIEAWEPSYGLTPGRVALRLEIRRAAGGELLFSIYGEKELRPSRAWNLILFQGRDRPGPPIGVGLASIVRAMARELSGPQA